MYNKARIEKIQYFTNKEINYYKLAPFSQWRNGNQNKLASQSAEHFFQSYVGYATNLIKRWKMLSILIYKKGTHYSIKRTRRLTKYYSHC